MLAIYVAVTSQLRWSVSAFICYTGEHMRLTAAEHLGHYEIHALLGAGGMGEVYRATDTRLGREIALKVLPAEMAADHDRLMRFHREARAAAALNHPNIVTLYSAEEIDGIHFFTMELVDGRPLDELIPAEGFPADRVVELAIAVGRGDRRRPRQGPRAPRPEAREHPGDQ